MPRWLPLALAAILGIALGLIYGWVIDPVQFVDMTPDTLRADYRADYVLMVAEAYHAEQNPDLAARRLAIFGSQPSGEIALQALQFGQGAGFPPAELDLLEELNRVMQAWQPVPPGAIR